MEKIKNGCLTGNQLKIIALITMTCDHVGKELLQDLAILQIIGRLAFPIFAYMIAEGAQYTRNRRKYLLTMAGLAFVCQIVYFVAMGSLYQCVLVTFSLSIGLIYLFNHARSERTPAAWAIAVTVLVTVYFVSEQLPMVLSHTDFMIDYGFAGIMLPVVVYPLRNKWEKLVAATLVLIMMCIPEGGIQWYSLLSVVLLALYNGKRGKRKLKNLFYIYYPLHLAAIYVISLLI